MPRRMPLCSLALGAALACSSASAEVYYVSPAGNDSATGDEAAPWRTIARAAAMLQAGDTVRILEGVYADERMPSELGCEHGTPDCGVPGIKPQNSGSPGLPITFEAWPPGAAVVIDQAGVPQGRGFFIAGDRHFIAIRGFEIRNASIAGIQTAGNVSNLLIEDCAIHGVAGAESIAGIRLEACRDSTIRGCDIFEIGPPGVADAAAITASDSANNVIEFNYLHGATHGVLVQRAADPGRDLTIRSNRIFDVQAGVLLAIGGLGDPAYEDPQIYGNWFYDVGDSAIATDTLLTASDSVALYIGNNTFARVGVAINLDRFQSVWITQNLMYPLGGGGPEDGFALVTRFDPGLLSFVEIDRNFYDPAARFELNRGSLAQQTFASPAAWMTYGYDLNSFTGDPRYIDAATDNFHIRRVSDCRNNGYFGFTPQLDETDIDGQPRIMDGLADIGADESDTVFRPDTNCDGFITFFDIDPFLLALFDPGAYGISFPNCTLRSADMNIDGAVNFFDIDIFVACLFGDLCP